MDVQPFYPQINLYSIKKYSLTDEERKISISRTLNAVESEHDHLRMCGTASLLTALATHPLSEDMHSYVQTYINKQLM